MRIESNYNSASIISKEDARRQIIIEQLLGREEDYKEKIRAAMRAAKQKGYGAPAIGSSAFINLVLEGRRAESEDYRVCAKEIMRIVSVIKKENEEKKKNRNKFTGFSESNRKHIPKTKNEPIQEDLPGL